MQNFRVLQKMQKNNMELTIFQHGKFQALHLLGYALVQKILMRWAKSSNNGSPYDRPRGTGLITSLI